MWGCNGRIFVNGIEIEGSDVFYDVITPFVPNDSVVRLEKWKDYWNRTRSIGGEKV